MENPRSEIAPPYILGLDGGVGSVGWAMLSADGKRLLRTGVRVFEAGVEGDIESGRDESRNLKRRQMRLQRRTLWRRARRLRKVFRWLQRAKLLPAGEAKTPPQRDELLKELDRGLFARHVTPALAAPAKQARSHLLPYLLRARALDHKLEPNELGRAIYHLAQRRGFLSNRREAAKPDEELGKVKQGIGELREAMDAAKARTLGEYFASLDPEQRRIRQRWTAREMYEQEFEAIWKAQAPHHPALLNDDLKRALRRAIFFQRPLKNQRFLIGKCELEAGRARAPIACLPAQRFRLLQKVNDLEVYAPDGEVLKLSPEQRAQLIEELETKGDLKFKALPKLLGLPKGCAFNLERGGEEKLPGNRTNAKFLSVFGPRWYQFSPAEHEAAIADVLSIQKREALKKRGAEHWKLADEQAEKFSALPLEEGHASLSRKAIEALLPLLEQGMAFATARKQEYPGSDKAGQVLPKLPPVMDALPALRNPMVARTLAELRKVVNAIVRQHGKPACIRVELARDLKRPRKQRQEIAERNRKNQKARDAAIAKLLTDAGLQNPKGSDIEKALLWEECKGICPYTGRSIDFRALFGREPQFDVEHIIPFSRSLDDSFLNKTLCHHDENRNVKRNHTPMEAYGGSAARWEQILACVKRFQGDAAREKLRRFRLTADEVKEMFESFSQRQLNDTRYASRLAVEYLGMLYGGPIDTDGTRRVQVGGGQATAFLRNEWNLNPILSDGPGKSRDDHRHHAIDAIVVALTDARTVQLLSQAAERALLERRRRFGQLAPPWPSFYEHVKASVAGIVVSHRVTRKVSGALHEETLYSPPRDGHGARADKGAYVHVRKPLAALSKGELENIVDPCVKKLVLDKLAGGDPKKVFADAQNHPALKTKDGRTIPIHKVRIRIKAGVEPLGREPHRRYIKTGANHHMEIIEVKDKKGRTAWEGVVVTLYEAKRRVRTRESVIRRDHGPDRKFLFTLAPTEAVRMKDDKGQPALFKATCVSEDEKGAVRLEFRRNCDARASIDLRKIKGGRVFKTPSSLKDADAEKVIVTPLGEVLPAHD